MDGIRLGKLQQIALVQHDVAAAVPFYRDKLGLPLQFEMNGLAFFDAAGVRLMLSQPSAPEFDHKNSILYFKVADLPATHAAIVARGAQNERAPQLTAKMPDHELWIGFVRDPDGNLIGLMSEVRA